MTATSKPTFTGPLALGLLATAPANDPVDAILWHARTLVIESGMSEPPFAPRSYAKLRNVRQILERNMAVDGRLIPTGKSFIVELRKDRSEQRKNFTCAHELAHTFFFEAVPLIKYRSSQSLEPHSDKEEELLCDIAASELLMPFKVFRKVAGDYSPSPQALRNIATLFETSLTATALRILRLQVWNATFILWQGADNHVTAQWVARPDGRLSYSPSLTVINSASSGIHHTWMTGEQTSTREYLQSDKGVWPCRLHSVKLGGDKVLSCIGSSISCSAKSNPSSAPRLPMSYRCECNGTGWRLTRRRGRTVAARCLASQHALTSLP